MKDNLKILVIGDNTPEQETVFPVLKKTGIDLDIENLNSLNYTLYKLKNKKSDYLLIDYNLQFKDSLNIIKKIQCLGIKIPIIIITIPEHEQTAIKLLAAGATEYFFHSQISPENLPLLLRSVMGLYQAEIKAETASQQLKQNHIKLIQQQQKLEQKNREIHLLKFKLLEASKIKSEFLSIISHELITPMNAIMGFSQMLLRPKLGNLTNKQIDMVKRIFNNGQKLLMILNDILDFSQLESGTFPLTVQKCNIDEIVDTSVEKIRATAKLKNLALFISKNLDNSLIWNDAGRVSQILNHLLANAVKFTENGSISISVQEIASDRLSITVLDTGIGIAAQNHQSIFEAFRQIDQGFNRQYSGKGIGLSLINSLVKMMGGKIILESELGVGSAFTVELPRKINPPDYINYENPTLIGSTVFKNTQNIINQESGVSVKI